MAIVLVVGMNAVKEAYEDYKRYKSDRLINNKNCKVIRDGIEVDEKWSRLAVGDIVVVRNNESFPADLVLLSTSGDVSPSICFVETSNLDGESNLKSKQALLETNQQLQSPTDFLTFQAKLQIESPSINLNSFHGVIKLLLTNENEQTDEEEEEVKDNNLNSISTFTTTSTSTYSLTLDQLLIRGTCLSNTDHVYGVVVYGGHQSKYMLNTRHTPYKRSRFDSYVNRILIAVFIFEFFLCLMSSLLGSTRYGRIGDTWYLPLGNDSTQDTLHLFFSFVVLFGGIAPFTMFLSLEFVRILQLITINRDKKMFHYESNSFACGRTSNLNEELGQVEYIFTDKTGTLTRNQMQVKKNMINNVVYQSRFYNSYHNGDNKNLKQSIKDNGNNNNKDKSKEEIELYEEEEEEYLGITMSKLGSSSDIENEMRSSNSSNSSNNINIKEEIDMNDPDTFEFFLALSICHSAIPESIDENGNIKYSSSSPDELALVKESSNMGIKFHTRTTNYLRINVLGIEREYKLLKVLEFDSDRKRMSVIVTHYDSDDIIMYCKGADSVILPRLLDYGDANNIVDLISSYKEHLHRFSCEGLRTLCVTKKIIPRDEYEPWSLKMNAANLLLNGRNERVGELSSEIEHGWSMLGIVGIEDRLQDRVPETIARLSDADIRIWMITGDKQETAINIGISCCLLDPEEDNYLILNETNILELQMKLELNLKQQLENIPQVNNNNSNNIRSIIIDGNTLSLLIGNKNLEDSFYKLANNVKSVVCCRFTPFQKSEVVRIVKERTSGITLAIGDGANDVSMIQRSHVGVGISGFEGRQAVLASDFAIAQFHYLERLVLVHGRWNYKRIATLLCYTFWKSIIISLIELWFNIFTGFSGSNIVDDINTLLLGVVYASVPVIIYGASDKDIDSVNIQNYPSLYKETQSSKNVRIKNVSTTPIFDNLINIYYKLKV
ncbi:hypothetical protein PPL_05062 [Heterostelium album PN500]|uniref:Phospholipid-transporting ATPase n=1 Tax=Heterostelium pallidum (strain ATCC 26659 / Pp 5 / PN500) TaxID=670386 RepID=D3B9B8_HETP5|nr:hypothetical protein PPL_05062 [Heterostelium album PN500]EFA81830.1 hypothetical protein PPL_05062 [Heterostelium album PN500]|eukprot:XP_020433947.1 hypothetical protein PPL_05062 [Heterostelium album PN500]